MTNPQRIAARLRSAPLFALAILAASSSSAIAQKAAAPPTLTGTIILHVTADSIPVAGATVAVGTANTVTDRLGVAKFTLPTGRRTFRVTPVGAVSVRRDSIRPG